jgi:multiple antibiotic resistance protein
VLALFLSTFIKFFFLLTPFFVLSTFLSMTRNFTARQRTALAIKVTVAVLVVALVIFAAGNFVFEVFGITLDAFRIGTGVLLLLTAIQLVTGGNEAESADAADNIAVVPLAIPVTVGPATTGALLVMGGESHGPGDLIAILAAIAAAIVLVGSFLLGSAHLERLIKKQGLVILSKITGLILAALAAQLIMIGVRAFLIRT